MMMILLHSTDTANLACSSSKFRGEVWGMELIRSLFWRGAISSGWRISHFSCQSEEWIENARYNDYNQWLRLGVFGEIDLDKKLWSDKFSAVPYYLHCTTRVIYTKGFFSLDRSHPMLSILQSSSICACFVELIYSFMLEVLVG
jgi:hypothetical protein